LSSEKNRELSIWLNQLNLSRQKSSLSLSHGGFLGRVFQKDRNKKTNDGVFLGTLRTFQNGILENILYGAFREMVYSGDFLITFIVNLPLSVDFFTNNTNL
jgi:hypothetical protein